MKRLKKYKKGERWLRWNGNIEAQEQHLRAIHKIDKKNKAEIRKLLRWTPEAYAKYLLTPWWRMKREQKLKSVGRQCEECGAKEELHVHHKTYARIGREKNKDLQVLCRTCHEKKHPDKVKRK